MGGRRLDLYKIFQVVTAAGGFEEVTKNRGWKQVGDIFQFPSTCTNSAYILKGVYIRNLVSLYIYIYIYINGHTSLFTESYMYILAWLGRRKVMVQGLATT